MAFLAKIIAIEHFSFVLDPSEHPKANILLTKTTLIPPFKIVYFVKPLEQIPLPQDFVSMCESWRSQLGEDLNILASEANIFL